MSKTSWIVATLVVQLLFTTAAADYAGCVFTQNCSDKTNTSCFPYQVANSTPVVNIWKDRPAMCSEYIGKPNCCTDVQNSLMYNQFNLLTSTFGSNNGGCDVCAANLVRFWCKYTCDPDQARFVKINPPQNVRNPQNGQLVFAVPFDFNITEDLACEIFTSCRKTSFISQLSQTQTSHGFFIFLGENSVTQSSSYIRLNFSSTGMDFLPHKCNASFPDGKDENGYAVNNTCDCNNCQDSCAALPALELPGLFGSVKWNILIIVYVVLTAEVLIFFLLKRKRAEEKASRRNSELEAGLAVQRDSGHHNNNNSRIYASDSSDKE